MHGRGDTEGRLGAQEKQAQREREALGQEKKRAEEERERVKEETERERERGDKLKAALEEAERGRQEQVMEMRWASLHRSRRNRSQKDRNSLSSLFSPEMRLLVFNFGCASGGAVRCLELTWRGGVQEEGGSGTGRVRGAPPPLPACAFAMRCPELTYSAPLPGAQRRSEESAEGQGGERRASWPRGVVRCAVLSERMARAGGSGSGSGGQGRGGKSAAEREGGEGG
eukprot:376213-Rhodomonas_salina.1